MPTADIQSRTPVQCPSCGASVSPGQSSCWLCHAPLAADETPASPFAPGHPFVPRAAGQFTIATILLVTTLIAVCLGLFRYSPGLGVLLIVFAAPALVRTVFVGRREQRLGRRLTTGGKIGQFFVSLIIMYAVWMAAGMAFFMTCAGSLGLAAVANSAAPETGGGVMMIGLIASLVFSAGVAVLILRATWPKGK